MKKRYQEILEVVVPSAYIAYAFRNQIMPVISLGLALTFVYHFFLARRETVGNAVILAARSTVFSFLVGYALCFPILMVALVIFHRPGELDGDIAFGYGIGIMVLWVPAWLVYGLFCWIAHARGLNKKPSEPA